MVARVPKIPFSIVYVEYCNMLNKNGISLDWSCSENAEGNS